MSRWFAVSSSWINAESHKLCGFYVKINAGGGQAWWEIPWEEVLETVGERRRVKWGCGM
jgi:hypothetical protein